MDSILFKKIDVVKNKFSISKGLKPSTLIIKDHVFLTRESYTTQYIKNSCDNAFIIKRVRQPKPQKAIIILDYFFRQYLEDIKLILQEDEKTIINKIKNKTYFLGDVNKIHY